MGTRSRLPSRPTPRARQLARPEPGLRHRQQTSKGDSNDRNRSLHVDVAIVAAFAGGGRAPPGPLAQTSEEEGHSTVDTFLTLKSFLPGMIELGGGSIVTMASSAARFPTGAPVPYAAAKAGVIVLTSQVANEVGSHNVRVNCLAPHTVLVERTKRFMTEEHQRRIAAEIPLRRLGTPEDVALATLFLASESSSWITGVTLDVAGGKVTD